MKQIKSIRKVVEYNTAYDPTDAPPGTLVAGSQNVLIDSRRGNVFSRGGYTRLGVANTALNPVRGSITWNNSNGGELMLRQYDDELEVYIDELDGEDISAWTRVKNALSTTEIVRFATWWNDSESLDNLLFVNGDSNLHQWSGGMCVVASVTANTITKAGTNTFAQNRFNTVGSKTLINVRTGTEFTYTGGEGTLTLTGVTGDPTADGMIEGDILVQKVVTNANEPASGRNNHIIYVYENQVHLQSEDDNEVYVSKNDDITDYSFSAPRVTGDGALFTLDGPGRGMVAVGGILTLFAGKSSIFRSTYEEITVGTTLAETLSVKQIYSGVNQGSFGPDSILSLGNEVVYLTNEPALRTFRDPSELAGLSPKTLSNPIQPDFDAETWTGARILWDKNSVYLSAPASSKLYILNYAETADGRLTRHWNPPQILPVRCLNSYQGYVYFHSNSVPETYRLFDGNSDTSSEDEKLPIHAIARFSYLDYGKPGNLKSFDEIYVQGDIAPSTNDLLVTLDYDFGGHTASIERTINGSDPTILEETLESTSLGQQSLGQQPFGGSRIIPTGAARYRVIFEIAKEDFHEIQTTFSSNNIDRYWSVHVHGVNAQLTARQPINIKL